MHERVWLPCASGSKTKTLRVMKHIKPTTKSANRRKGSKSKEQGITNAMKRNLTLKINEYKRKFNNALKFRTKLIEERKKHNAKRVNMRRVYKEVYDRLQAIRKMRSCTNSKCKDALFE